MGTFEDERFKSLRLSQSIINQTIIGLLIEHGMSPEVVVERFRAAADVVESQGDLVTASDQVEPLAKCRTAH